MAIQPEGALLLITGGITLVVNTVSYSSSYIPFDRLENDNSKLREAKTAQGEKRIIIEFLGGGSGQVVTDCVSNIDAVPLVPNTTTTFNNVAKKFDVLKYDIQGAISTAANVNSLFTLAAAHQQLLAQFEAYTKRASGDTPYEDLILLQAETFSYLTTTGISVTGSAIEGSVTDVLITSISVENAISFPDIANVNQFYKTFNISFEKRTVSTLA